MINTDWSEQVNDLARDAWWYACGRNDERRGQPLGVTLTYVDPWKFSRAYGDLAHRYDIKEVFHRPSIQDAFKEVADA